MNDSQMTSEKFITLSREYVDDVMGDRKIRITKEHYYIFAISNFIATKEHFLKKNNNSNKVIFNRIDNINILPMIVEFYNSIKSKNKGFTVPSIQSAKDTIIIIPSGIYDDEEYLALYIFNDIRNALSHFGNYEIIENNGEYTMFIKTKNFSTISIPIELFDFIAFYINSYNEGKDAVDDIFENYLIYKESKDNKKYYKYESKNAINKIVNLLAKTQIRIKQKTQTLTKNKGGYDSHEHIDEVLDEFIYNYGEKTSNEILNKIRKAKLSEEQMLEILVELNIRFRAEKRLTNKKIDNCIENLEEILKLDRKSTSLYSHSIILFTHRKEPDKKNAQEVLSLVNRIKNDIMSIEIGSLEKLDNNDRKEILEKYKQSIENLLKELPNLIRINEHKYRNSIVHNNINFEGNKLHFWDQKDNTNPNENHKFDIYKTKEAYNSELKSIENYNWNVGEMTIEELFSIFNQYYDTDIVNEMTGKLWNINQFDNELLKWNMSIYEFLDNINKKIQEFQRGH